MRVVNLRKTAKYDVYIGRPSKWGNPFKIGRDGSRDIVLKKYKNYLKDHPRLVERAKRELREKTLGCYCSPAPCHGDILIELINEEE